MYQEAIAESEMIDSLLDKPNSDFTTSFRQLASGNRAEAIETLENWEGLSSYGKATRYAMLGERDLAIEWLTQAADERDNSATWANVNSFFDPLRDDPRFQDLLRRMNLEP